MRASDHDVMRETSNHAQGKVSGKAPAPSPARLTGFLPRSDILTFIMLLASVAFRPSYLWLAASSSCNSHTIDLTRISLKPTLNKNKAVHPQIHTLQPSAGRLHHTILSTTQPIYGRCSQGFEEGLFSDNPRGHSSQSCRTACSVHPTVHLYWRQKPPPSRCDERWNPVPNPSSSPTQTAHNISRVILLLHRHLRSRGEKTEHECSRC